MKIFSILLFTFTCFFGNAQLYISEYTGEMLFGPENVAPTNVDVCSQMIDELVTVEEARLALQEELIVLQTKENLSRKEKRRLKKLTENEILVARDLEAVKLQIGNWEDHKELLLSINTTTCYLLDRDGKEYTVENTLLTTSSTDYPRAYIDLVVTQLKATKWVKKKADKNCQSADPNDCLVWCLVDTEKVTYDLYGNLIEQFQLENLGLDFDSKMNRYYGKTIDSSGDKNYALISNENSQIISMSGILLIDCTD